MGSFDEELLLRHCIDSFVGVVPLLDNRDIGDLFLIDYTWLPSPLADIYKEVTKTFWDVLLERIENLDVQRKRSSNEV